MWAFVDQFFVFLNVCEYLDLETEHHLLLRHFESAATSVCGVTSHAALTSAVLPWERTDDKRCDSSHLLPLRTALTGWKGCCHPARRLCRPRHPCDFQPWHKTDKPSESGLRRRGCRRRSVCADPRNRKVCRSKGRTQWNAHPQTHKRTL